MNDRDPALPEIDRLPPMTHYVVGLLRRPPSRPAVDPATAEQLQERHLAHLRILRESGELLTTGPMEEPTDLRGLMVFRTDRVDRARELMGADPLVGGGYLVLELFTWFAPAGLAVAPNPSRGEALTFETD